MYRIKLDIYFIFSSWNDEIPISNHIILNTARKKISQEPFREFLLETDRKCNTDISIDFISKHMQFQDRSISNR